MVLIVVGGSVRRSKEGEQEIEAVFGGSLGEGGRNRKVKALLKLPDRSCPFRVRWHKKEAAPIPRLEYRYKYSAQGEIFVQAKGYFNG